MCVGGMGGTNFLMIGGCVVSNQLLLAVSLARTEAA